MNYHPFVVGSSPVVGRHFGSTILPEKCRHALRQINPSPASRLYSCKHGPSIDPTPESAQRLKYRSESAEFNGAHFTRNAAPPKKWISPFYQPHAPLSAGVTLGSDLAHRRMERAEIEMILETATVDAGAPLSKLR
jgi:hypothetical protein